ncbi:hypothetical protein GWK47_038225 [Chionoecetes opilio]|uniref:Uncharacterized protein n=1 Tax=Chionoecetes opilio TaxID=41210 RepID=A0A8J4YLA8_CHIOP|nr:hypothetical protein GWK47_038225 [Chionoecetes opilio]
MRGAPRWPTPRNPDEPSLVPLATGVSVLMACRLARVFRRDGEGGGAEETPGWPCPQGTSASRGNTGAHQKTSLAPHSLIQGGFPPGLAGGPMSPPPPNKAPAPVGAPRRRVHRHAVACRKTPQRGFGTTRERRKGNALFPMAPRSRAGRPVSLYCGSVDPGSGEQVPRFCPGWDRDVLANSETAPPSRNELVGPSSTPRTRPAPPGGSCGNTTAPPDGLQAPPTAASKGQLGEGHHHHPGEPTDLGAQGRGWAKGPKWIPSQSRGFPGERGGGAGAPKRPLNGPPSLHFPPHLQQLKAQGERAAHTAPSP